MCGGIDASNMWVCQKRRVTVCVAHTVSALDLLVWLKRLERSTRKADDLRKRGKRYLDHKWTARSNMVHLDNGDRLHVVDLDIPIDLCARLQRASDWHGDTSTALTICCGVWRSIVLEDVFNPSRSPPNREMTVCLVFRFKCVVWSEVEQAKSA